MYTEYLDFYWVPGRTLVYNYKLIWNYVQNMYTKNLEIIGFREDPIL